jgi:shikimate dehydrogenase
VVRALDGLGVASITILARDADRARSVADIATNRTEVAPLDAAPDVAGGADLVVNATPLGAAGEDALPGVRFRTGQLVVDLVYQPPSTPLMLRARADGATASNGLGMLVHQAAASFRIWTGSEPSLETMSAAALHSIRSP